VGVNNPEAVLNGIAPGPAEDTLFVTGKLWPQLFHIRLLPEKNRLQTTGGSSEDAAQ
jgi:glutamine cyclotransferase